MAVSADLPDNSVVHVNAEGDGGLQYVVHTLGAVAVPTNGNGKRPQYGSPGDDEDEEDFDEMQA